MTQLVPIELLKEAIIECGYDCSDMAPFAGWERIKVYDRSITNKHLTFTFALNGAGLLWLGRSSKRAILSMNIYDPDSITTIQNELREMKKNHYEANS